MAFEARQLRALKFQMHPRNDEDRAWKFLIEEFKALRVEIENRSKETHQMIVFAITGLSAYFSWVIGSKVLDGLSGPMRTVIAVVPLMLVVLLWVRAHLAHKAIERIGDYIQSIEQAAKLPEGLGWEGSLRRSARAERPGSQGKGIAERANWSAEFVFYMTLGLLAFCFALFVFGWSPAMLLDLL